MLPVVTTRSLVLIFFACVAIWIAIGGFLPSWLTVLLWVGLFFFQLFVLFKMWLTRGAHNRDAS